MVSKVIIANNYVKEKLIMPQTGQNFMPPTSMYILGHEKINFFEEQKPLKTVWRDCTANSTIVMQRLTKMLTSDGQINERSARQTNIIIISRICFAVLPKS